MKIAAIIFLALYLLIGVRSIFWNQTIPRIRSGLRTDAPRWRVFLLLAIVLPLDAFLWPVNAINNHRRHRP